MKNILLVGCYGDGIHIIEVDEKEKKTTLTGTFNECENPSYLAAYGNKVYAVNEFQDKAYLTALAFADGSLRKLNQTDIPGAGACHLSVDPGGEFLYAANYISGDLVSCAIDARGNIAGILSHIVHEGESSHCHAVVPAPCGKRLVAVNLGTEGLYFYLTQKGKLIPEKPHPAVKLPLGEGPRHFVFHPNGRFGYLVTEYSNKVVAFAYNQKLGELRFICQESLLPDGYDKESYAAGIVMSPDGRYLYASNRGYDHLTVFAADAKTGLLKLQGRYPCGGAWPRDFCLSKAGDMLIVANQNSDSIVSFRADQKTGAMGEVLDSIHISKPTCTLWLTVAD